MQTRTRRQKEVLDYITRYIESHGYEPSYQMIARFLGVSSKAGVAKHIKALEDQGHLQRRRENGSFSIALKQIKNTNYNAVAVIDWIDLPGHQDELETWETAPFSVPDFMLGGLEPESLCAFRVPDDAMLEKNICHGDILLIEKRPYVRDGGLAVATIKGKETVFRSFYREGADIELRAANGNFETLRLVADDVKIHGIFKSLLRLPA